MKRLAVFLAAAALLALMSTPADCADQQPRRKFAVLVGVENYRLAPLLFPARDVSLLRRRLTSIGFDRANILEIVDRDDENGTPLTRTRLTDAFRKATVDDWKVGPNDLILFAYSGHGASKDGESMLVLSDRIGDASESRVPIGDIYQRLVNCPARDKVVVIDAGRDETQQAVPPGGPDGDAGKLREECFQSFEFRATPAMPRGIFVMQSCGANESSLEDNTPSVRNSVYFYRLAEGIQHLARTRPEGFTCSDLQDFVRRTVPMHVEWLKNRDATLRAALRDRTQTPHFSAFDLIAAPVLYRASEVQGAPRR